MNNARIKVLVLGSSGMLGNTIFNYFFNDDGFETYGTIRSSSKLRFLESTWQNIITDLVIGQNDDVLLKILNDIHPHVVINCIGIVKQLKDAEDPLISVPINSLLPHKLVKLCESINARLIHVSTDCVFSGAKGMYVEDDISDANDLYGRTKYIGEVNHSNAVTLRTSIIGHEPNQKNKSLVDWFIAQKSAVPGYKNAIFSGLPCIELASIIKNFVLPSPSLCGVYHVSANPISKYHLLKLIAEVYKINTEVYPDDSIIIDRSLDSSRFCKATGYKVTPWLDLIIQMHNFQHKKRA